MRKFIVIIILIQLTGCYTPSRLGISYQGELIHATSYNTVENPNINVLINSLTSQDKQKDIAKINGRFILT
ncbi:MAG: hypothetical protein KOO66_05155 [Bacteroidales bacterium]|nr:hypothetical protein [Bacteroidales bacterium]